MTGDEKPVISVEKVRYVRGQSKFTYFVFKSTYFAWEYILLKIGKNSFREKYGKYLCFWNNIYNR